MGNIRWKYKVLKNNDVIEICAKHRNSIRIELTKGNMSAYHLEVKTTNGFEIMGRINKRLISKWIETGEVIPMETQRGFINIFDYKLKPVETKP